MKIRLVFATAVVALAMLAGACSSKQDVSPADTATQPPMAVETVTTVAPTATMVAPTLTPTPAPVVDHIQIKSIKLDAQLVTVDVAPDKDVASAPNNDVIQVFDFKGEYKDAFGGMPGSGNAVMVGNLNSGSAPCQKGTVPPPCEAVMKDLHRVNIGDAVQVGWQGVLQDYKVVAICNATADTLPVASVYATTTQERITLLTAGGDFDAKTGSYAAWVIIVVEKEGSKSTCPTGTKPGLPPVSNDAAKAGA